MMQLHRQLRGMAMRFNDFKTDTLNLRVAPSFKKMLKAVADEENRSMVNMLEVILIDYCQRHGMPDPEAVNSRGKAHG